jgi:hypothetical protein
MIYISSLDRPGFIGRFASILGDAGINIATFHLGRDVPRGNATTLIEIERRIADRRARRGPRASAGAASAAAEVLKGSHAEGPIALAEFSSATAARAVRLGVIARTSLAWVSAVGSCRPFQGLGCAFDQYALDRIANRNAPQGAPC